LQELLETIHTILKQPHNATNVAVFQFPHLTTPPPSGPPPLAPHPPAGNRSSTPIINNNGNHQYQIPGYSPSAIATPVYAVTNVNPNVKNISHVQLMSTVSATASGLPLPLHLQIPAASQHPLTHVVLHNQRSGSQASSGYQSQSPVLEGDKSKNSSPQMSSGGTSSLEAEGGKSGIPWTERKDNSGSAVRVVTPLSFSNPGFTDRKPGSQSVDDLSSVGQKEEIESKKRYVKVESFFFTNFHKSDIFLPTG